MKIAWFSPFRRGGSGIAWVSAAACDGLMSDGHEVVVFASDVRDAGPVVRTDLPMVGLDGVDHGEVLRGLPGFDLVVYHLGNSYLFHTPIYEFSRQYPGIVVLHDLVMRDFFWMYYQEVRQGDFAGLLRLMEYCHGAPGRAWLEALAAGRISDVWSDPHVREYHMARAAVAGARGVVVHSEFSRAWVAEFAGAPVARLAFPTPPMAEEALGWDPPAAAAGRPIRLLTYGHINRNKLVDLVIECLGASPTLRRGVVYTVVGAVGDPRYRDHLDRLVARLDLAESVRVVGPKSDAELHEKIRAADVVLNLRNPHLGESSWSLSETLFAARPTIVWDHGSYAEVPDWAVCKVAGREELAAALEVLCADAGRRRALGEAARRYARETFDSRGYGRGLLTFAETLRSHHPVLDLSDRVGRLVREMTDGPGSQVVLERLAGEIGWLADDDPAVSAPRRRRAVSGGAVGVDRST
jgi:glycosyltransferase involved in cell wall biosynthesis